MNKKKKWSKWFDQLDDEKISHLFINKDKLKDLNSEVDYKIITAIKNAENYNKKQNAIVRILEYFAINSKILKFSLVTLVLITCLLYGFLYKDIFIYKQKKDSSFLVTSIRGNGYYFDENGVEKVLDENLEIKNELTLLTDKISDVTVSKKDVIQIDLKPKSKMKIKDDKDMTSAFLFTGIALFDVNKEFLRKDFIVDSYVFNIIVTGTKFTVSINEKGFSKINLDRGKLKVKINYNYADEVKILKNKDKLFALKINKILNEYINLSSGTTLIVKMNDFLESKRNIKELFNIIMKDYDNKLIDESKKSEMILNIKKIMLKSYILIQPEKINIKESKKDKKDDLKLEEKNIKGKEIKDKNLIGEWLFNGNANDSTDYVNNGEIKGAKLTKNRFGNENSAYYFNGKSYIKINNNKTLKNIEKTNLFSVSVWINIEKWNQGYFPIIDKYSKENDLGYLIDTNSSEGVHFLNYTNNYFNSNYMTNPGMWYHIVFINDSKNKKMYFYINGKKVKEENYYFYLKTNDDLYIGYGPSKLEEYAIGTIDDLRIYNSALSEDQIYMLYTEDGWSDEMLSNGNMEISNDSEVSNIIEEGKSVEINDNGLIGEWLFNGNANDSTDYVNNGEIKGAKLTKDRFGNENSAYYFDGKSYIIIKNNKVLKGIEKTNLFSISAWINVNDWNHGYFIILDNYSKEKNNGYLLNSNSSEGISFLNYPDNFFRSPNKKIEKNLWYHIVFINDSINNKKIFYINNTKIIEDRFSFFIKCYNDLYIGYVPSRGIEFGPSRLTDHNLNTIYGTASLEGYAIGIIDDLRIYNSALDKDKVNELYTEGGWSDTMQNKK